MTLPCPKLEIEEEGPNPLFWSWGLPKYQGNYKSLDKVLESD